MPRYSQSSPYPTGRAPLAFDLSEQMWNIAQQRIQNRKQEIEDQQKEISDNEKILLTALDFETVKGAQDKFAQDMATRIDQMTNKWSERMKGKGGILDTTDKLELLRDKRDIENRIQVGAADVAEFQQLAKDATDPKKAAMYDPQTWIDLGKYALDGKIGSGQAINIPKYKPQAVGQDFMAEVEGLAQSMKLNTNLSQEPTGIREDGQTKWKYTNKPLVNNLVARAQMLPSFQALAKENYGQAMELLNSIPNFYTIERFDYEKNGTATSATGGKSVAQVKAEQEQNEKFGTFNNIALNLMDMDEAQVTKLKSAEPGKIRDIYYEQNPEGTTDMYIEFQPESAGGTKLGRGIEKIRLPKDANDKAGIDLFYSKLHQVLPPEMKQGVDVSDIPKTIKPRVGQYTGNKVPIRTIQKIEGKLDEAITKPKSGMFKAAADSLNTWLKKINPKAPKIEGTNKGFTIDGKDYKFIDPPAGTVNTPEAFKNRVMENVKPQKQIDPNAPEAESSAPATQTYDVGGEKYHIPTEMVTEFIKDNPTAKRVQ